MKLFTERLSKYNTTHFSTFLKQRHMSRVNILLTSLSVTHEVSKRHISRLTPLYLLNARNTFISY